MPDSIRIGTRESKLAIWQAELVRGLLAAKGFESELVFIRSEGDINLTTPLYELGVQGIFTKALDIALLEGKIDVAVHSYKDVPTQPAGGIIVAAILERGSHGDMLVLNTSRNNGELWPDGYKPVIATSSIRRKAQWLHRYPGSTMENLRGNVNTRLQKLSAAQWDGAIFAAAGLERLALTEAETGKQILLDWMLPAPAQGAIAVVCLESATHIADACRQLDHLPTRICTQVERDFLRILQGGCSTPISGLATINNERVHFRGNITATDGSDSIDVEADKRLDEYSSIAKEAAGELLEKGGSKYIQR